MQADLVTRLTGASAIAALCGQRVSWFWRQRGDAVPAISLTLISPGREWTHAGPDGLDGPRVQFDLWARTFDQVTALKAAVLAEMEQLREAGGTRFHEGWLESERWVSEGEQDGGEMLLRIALDFMFYHEEI